MARDAAVGDVDRAGLPPGSSRTVGRGYEEIVVPPPPLRRPAAGELVRIADALREHPELLSAMRGVHTLNRLQSAVFPAAFHSPDNLLVCAPTGAGKTNVALLTVFREVVAVNARLQPAFKVVYVAPMKALAAEVAAKFADRLAPLGLRVREFTGDMSLTRAEAMHTHVLVTTPEKWDVVTRKSGSDLGDAVTLFIVDEIHLLHDERGAVLESIVARTLRLSETAEKQIRLVGLSATLPNYADVGAFMRVDPAKGLFHFDGSHRPVPLSQTFIGISEGGTGNSPEARRRRQNKMHEMAWAKVKDSLQRGHQAMIFVHSRKGTVSAAREMLSRAAQDLLEDIFLGGEGKGKGGDGEEAPSAVVPSWASKEINKSKSADIRELCARGVGIHNAGLQRTDRKLVEKLFADGVLRLLCCTATLAWGINLPARTVVIMGTEVYDAQKGGFVQLGMLDVMQIFGRAGRPQFDTEGEGTIITMHEHLSKYLSLLTSSVPIESQLGSSASRLADHLNAEIVSGTVSSIGEGVRWLSYTYLSVRMPQNPLVYGIEWAEVQADSGLHSRRATLIEQAAKALDDARMCRYDPRTGVLAATDLGRVSSHFYVSHETVVLWNELLGNLSLQPAVTDEDWKEVYGIAIHAVSCATEFEQMRVRQEELEELDHLTRSYGEIPLKSGAETREGKVAVLLQAYISRAPIRMSDLSYIIESSTRLLRALFEVSIRRGLPSLSLASLELARASELRIWPFLHPLWQFTHTTRKASSLLVHSEVVAAIQEQGDKSSIDQLRKMSKEELSVLVRAPKMCAAVQKAVNAVPTLQIVSASVSPLSRTVLLVEVKLFPNFRWNDSLHGNAESWWMWIEDHEEDRVYHSQRILLTKSQARALTGEQPDYSSNKDTIDYAFHVPVFDPPSSQYWVRIESEQWHTGGGSRAALSLLKVKLPEEEEHATELLDLRPLPVHSALSAEEAVLFEEGLTHFSPLQTQAFHVLRHTDENVLVSTPLGSGKEILPEFAILRALKEQPGKSIIYVAPHEDTLKLKEKEWQRLRRMTKGKLQMLDSSFVRKPGSKTLNTGILLCTAENWNHFSSAWDDETIAEGVSLIVFDDLHLLSVVPGLEVAILRLRAIQSQQQSTTKEHPRIMGLSATLPNAGALGDWLGVQRSTGLFCFDHGIRQVPCESHVVGVAGDRYNSRMHSMNRTLFSMTQRYSAKKPILIYVSSRRQGLLTAQDLVRLATVDGKKNVFSSSTSSVTGVLAKALRDVSDPGLRRYLASGIGLYHESLSARDRDAVEVCYREGHVQVVIATFAMAKRAVLSSHLVIVKGTEIYDCNRRRYEDVPVPDLLHMIGQAGRPGTDTVCYTIVFVHEPKKTLFKKFMHEALPVESALHKNLSKILLQEIVSGRILSFCDAVEFVASSFLYQRLTTNPGYYGQVKNGERNERRLPINNKSLNSRVNWSCHAVSEALRTLHDGSFILPAEELSATATALGYISASYDLTLEQSRALYFDLQISESFEDVCKAIFSRTKQPPPAPSYDEENAWNALSHLISQTFCDFGFFEKSETAAKALAITRCCESGEKRQRAACYGMLIGAKAQTVALGVDVVDMFKNVDKCIGASFDLAAELGSLSLVRHVITLSQSWYQGLLPTNDFWRLTGLSTEPFSEKGRAEGFISIDNVLDGELDFTRFTAKHCDHEGQRGRIGNWLGRYPRLSLSATKKAKANKTEIVVEMKVSRRTAMHFDGADALSPMTRKRVGGYAIVVGNAERNCVRTVRRVSDDVRKEKRLSFSFPTDLEGESADMTDVWVASDVYVGVSAEAKIL